MTSIYTGYVSTIPLYNTITFESNETLNSAATRASSASNVAVTRTSSTILSIANGASSSARQYVRFNPQTSVITAALVLTITGGTGSGKVDIYGQLSTAGALLVFVYDTSGNTFTLTGTGSLVLAATGQQLPAGSVLLYSWTITAATFDSAGGTDQQLPTDCWIDSICIANTTAGSVTVTATDSQSSPIYALAAVSIPANSTSLVVFPGGRYFQGGLKLNAGAANSIDCNFRGVRLRRAQLNP